MKTHPLVEDLIRWASRGGAAEERLARAESRLLRARKGETRSARGAVTRARAAFATAAKRQESARLRLIERLAEGPP